MLTEEQQKKLADYLAEYIAEEENRGNDNLDYHWIIWNGINAWIGGAR